MFCPRCGTENNSDLKHCRKCGQGLSSVRLALEGRVDDAISTLEKEQRLSVHRVRIVVSVFLILTAVTTLLTGGRVGIVNVPSAAVLLIITLLFFLQLERKSRRVARLLNPEDELKGLVTAQTASIDSALPAATTAALPLPPSPMSVTERTTLKLDSKS